MKFFFTFIAILFVSGLGQAQTGIIKLYEDNAPGSEIVVEKVNEILVLMEK